MISGHVEMVCTMCLVCLFNPCHSEFLGWHWINRKMSDLTHIHQHYSTSTKIRPNHTNPKQYKLWHSRDGTLWTLHCMVISWKSRRCLFSRQCCCPYYYHRSHQWRQFHWQWPIDIILSKACRSLTTCIDITACCLAVQSHFLHQCWLLIDIVL